MVGPEMPVHDYAATPFLVYTIAMSAITAAVVIWWATTAERKRGWTLPILLVGGFISGLVEPFLDNIVLFWWPPEQDLAAFEAWGRTIPWFVPIGYAWFCGAMLYLGARIFANGVSRKAVWIFLGFVLFVDWFAIASATWIGVAGFFGEPPLNILGHPVWNATIDTMYVAVGSALVLFLAPRLQGLRKLWLVLVPTIVLSAAGGVVGGPVSMAMHSGWSMPAKYLAALVSIGFSFLICRWITFLVSEPVKYLGEVNAVDSGWPNRSAVSHPARDNASSRTRSSDSTGG